MPIYSFALTAPTEAYDEDFPTRCTESLSYELQSSLSAITKTLYLPTTEEIQTFWDSLVESYNNLSEYVNQWLSYMGGIGNEPTATLPGITVSDVMKGFPGTLQIVSDFMRVRHIAACLQQQCAYDLNGTPGRITSLNDVMEFYLDGIKTLLSQELGREPILNIGDFQVWTKSACVDGVL